MTKRKLAWELTWSDHGAPLVRKRVIHAITETSVQLRVCGLSAYRWDYQNGITYRRWHLTELQAWKEAQRVTWASKEKTRRALSSCIRFQEKKLARERKIYFTTSRRLGKLFEAKNAAGKK